MSLQETNKGLDTFKGIGGITLSDSGGRRTARLAWCGEFPDKLRLTLITAGLPAETVTADGKYICLLSHTGEHAFIKKRSSCPSLEKLVSIPIRADDIVSLLTGRIPLYDYDEAVCFRPENGTGYVLVLRNKRKGIVEHIYLDDSRINVMSIEVFSSRNALLYTAKFFEMQESSGFQVPARLVVSDADASLTLRVDRYMANAEVSPELFILSPP